MPEEKNKCSVSIKPMAAWIAEEDPQGVCRECLLGPVLQWYREELETKGHSEKSSDLGKIAETPEVLPLQLCQQFDKIKGEVEGPLRERLLDFDCAVQSYKPE